MMKFTPTTNKVVLDVALPGEYRTVGKIIIPTKFSLQREQDDDATVRKGTVIGVPVDRTDQPGHPYDVGTEVEIEDGDVVYGHHFISNERSHLTFKEKKIVHIDYYNLYCKIVDDEIKMLGHWNLLELIEIKETTAAGLYIPRKDGYEIDPEESMVAKMIHLNNRAKAMGLKEGDTVRLKDADRDYKLMIEGREYIRVLNWDIVGCYTASKEAS